MCVFFLFRLEENEQQQLRAEKGIVEAPGSNACRRPLLGAINRLMHHSADDLQPANVEVKWRTKNYFKTKPWNIPFHSSNTLKWEIIRGGERLETISVIFLSDICITLTNRKCFALVIPTLCENDLPPILHVTCIVKQRTNTQTSHCWYRFGRPISNLSNSAKIHAAVSLQQQKGDFLHQKMF